jgi:hypothetical protein
MHLEAVQRANRQFDAGEYPYMMESSAPTRDKFQDIVEAIFAAPDRETALAIVDSYENYWMEIIGTRGDKGKKVKNAKSMAKKLMTIEGSGVKIEKAKKEAAKPISLDHLIEG